MSPIKVGMDGTYSVARVLARRRGRDINVLPVLAGAVGIDHAGVRTATVSVDLVQRHLHLAALRHLRQLLARLGHDGLGARLELVVARADRLAKRVRRVALEPRAVLLEGVAARPVARRARVDAQRHARAAGVAGRGDDGAVAGHELGGGEQGGEEEGLEGCHCCCCCLMLVSCKEGKVVD